MRDRAYLQIRNSLLRISLRVIKEAEERIIDCVADMILKPAKAKLKVVGD